MLLYCIMHTRRLPHDYMVLELIYHKQDTLFYTKLLIALTDNIMILVSYLAGTQQLASLFKAEYTATQAK